MDSNNRKKIIIGDVAKKAGVSTATVSRVLNNFPGVSPVIVKRVNEVISELGYIKTNKKNNKIGIVIPHIENPYTSNLIKNIQDTLTNLGYVTLIMDSDNNEEKAIECVDILIESGISGLIFIPTHGQNKSELILDSYDIPIVLLGRKIKINKPCFVGSETYIGSYNGAKYLLSLGHKEILYITGDRNNILNNENTSDLDGFKGFIKALEENYITFDINNLISGDYTMSTTYDLVREKLENSKCSAIFTSGDVMAYGAYKAVYSMGYKIPQDISLLGFDNLPMSEVLDLTTISQNAFGIGQNAALMLIDLIEKRKEPPLEVLLPTNLCIRSTCSICRN